MPGRASDDAAGLLGLLADRGVEFVLVGGLAAVAQGVPLVTFDADIVHRRTPENVDRLLALLREVGAHARGRPEGERLLPGRDAFLGAGHQLLQTDLGAIDVLGAIEQGLTYDDLLADSVVLRLGDRDVRVLSLRRMVELKSRSPREKDRLALAQMRAVLAVRDERGED